MPTINPKIQDAFNDLIEITEQELGGIIKSCTASMNKNDYDAVRAPFEQAAEVSKFLQHLTELRKDWNRLLGEVREAKPTGVQKRTPIIKLPRGSLTHLDAFTRPVLQALVDIGGKGTRSEVFERLLKSMNKTFTKYDFGFTPSRPKAPRWHDTLDRAYKLMRKSGLLSTDTPIGIWEISQKGRDFLKESSAK